MANIKPIIDDIFGGVLPWAKSSGQRALNAWSRPNSMYKAAARKMAINAAAGATIGGVGMGAVSSAQGRGFGRGFRRGATIGAMAGGVYGARGTGLKTRAMSGANRYMNRGKATATSNRGMPSWYGGAGRPGPDTGGILTPGMIDGLLKGR